MNLTKDAVWEILLRLPVRSLLRFRCVSKNWCALIESSLFKDRYLALRIASDGVDEFIVVNHTLGFGSNWRDCKNLVTCCYGDYESLALSVSAASSKNYFEISVSDSGNHSDPLIFVNHVNGIVCLADYVGFGRLNVTLLNPSLRQPRKLPCLGFKCYPQGIGFGFDVATNDYKVVAIIRTFCEEGRKDIAVVYHLSTDSWKTLGNMPAFVSESEFCWPYCYPCIFSHGSIHWCVEWQGHNQQIITFNMTNELFQEIHFPPGWKDYGYGPRPNLFTVDESTIALVARTRQVLDVWVMKEYGLRECWTKQYSVRSLPSIRKPLCYWRKDKLLLETNSGELICLLKGQVYQPELCDPICLLSDPNTVSLELLSCIESFVSVK